MIFDFVNRNRIEVESDLVRICLNFYNFLEILSVMSYNVYNKKILINSFGIVTFCRKCFDKSLISIT